MSRWTAGYIILWAALIGVELVGVFWNFHSLDTMTANWRYITARFPWANVLLTVFLIWLWYHLVIEKPKLPQ